MLETQRLILRQIISDDVDDIFEYAQSENVGPNAGWKPHSDKEETLEIMNDIFLNKENVFGIVLKESTKLIGSIGLVEDPKRKYVKARMLGYAIGEPYWGNGYTTEATMEILRYGFEDLKLQIISVYCYPFNLRSKRVIEKCGFRYEGTLKMAEMLYNGKIYDNVCFSLTNHEWCINNKSI